MSYHYHEAQAMANLLPEGYRLRHDRFSLGQQLLNIPAGFLHHLKHTVNKGIKAGRLSTFPVGSLDTLYRVYLGQEQSFQQDYSDPRQTKWIAPALYGFIDNTSYSVTIKDSLEELEDDLPSRAAVDATLSLTDPVLADTAVDNLHTASFNTPSIPGYLYLTLKNSTQMGIYRQGVFYPMEIHLQGLTTKGTVEDEVLAFPGNLTRRTLKHYQQVIQVRARNVVPGTATLSIAGADGNYPYHLDLDVAIPAGRHDQYAIWSLTDGFLSCNYFILQESDRVVLDSYLAWQLVDNVDLPIPNTSIALLPNSDIILAVNDTNLYFYSKLLEYPSSQTLSLLKNQTDGCLMSIETDSFFVAPNEEIYLRPYVNSPVKWITKYYWQVAIPGGPLVPYKADSNNNLVPAGSINEATILNANYKQYAIQQQYKLALSYPDGWFLDPWFDDWFYSLSGYWTVSLTVTYADGTTSTDVRLIGALMKSPILSFDLSSDLPEGTVLDNVFVDSEERVWVASGNGAYRIDFSYDTALIDYVKKLIYFKERYDSVEVVV